MASIISISDQRLFNLLKKKFGENEAEGFVALIKKEIKESEVKTKISESKFQTILPLFILWLAQVATIIILITVAIKHSHKNYLLREEILANEQITRFIDFHELKNHPSTKPHSQIVSKILHHFH